MKFLLFNVYDTQTKLNDWQKNYHPSWIMRRPTAASLILSRLLPSALICLLGLTSCDKLPQSINKTTPSASTAASSSTGNVAAQQNTDSEAQATDTPQKPEAVDYPFSQWQQQPVKVLPINNIQTLNQQLTQQLGKSPQTDSKSLDFTSNLATQYQFAPPTKPYFDVIDSPKFLELGWYYASPNDRMQEKQKSVDYAEEVYQLARGWFGNREGAQLVENMLMGQTVRNQTINGVAVTLAQCEVFSCTLVLKKS